MDRLKLQIHLDTIQSITSNIKPASFLTCLFHFPVLFFQPSSFSPSFLSLQLYSFSSVASVFDCLQDTVVNPLHPLNKHPMASLGCPSFISTELIALWEPGLYIVYWNKKSLLLFQAIVIHVTLEIFADTLLLFEEVELCVPRSTQWTQCSILVMIALECCDQPRHQLLIYWLIGLCW